MVCNDRTLIFHLEILMKRGKKIPEILMKVELLEVAI